MVFARMAMKSTTTTAAALLVAALVLAGCGRRDETSPLGTTDAPATTQVSGDAAAQVSREAAEATRQASIAAQEASKSAADQATNKVADALITTSVSNELAKDPTLAALHIDVDTDAGRVALRGTAPDQAAKDRATQIASAVQGVVSVENQLEVLHS
jgi:osmotically-inducible protein OsmY